MAIDGVSQTSGVERLLDVSQADNGVQFVIRDRIGNVERESIVLPADEILVQLTDRTDGGKTIEGTSPVRDERRLLDIEVRRNEVWLTVRPESAEGCDVAVGLDDLMDALAGVLPAV